MKAERGTVAERAASARSWLPPAAVACVAFLAFAPALRGGFVWDDLGNFAANPAYRGLGREQLRWMLTTTHLGPYQPLTWLTYALDFEMWGMDPAGYRLTNVLIHAVNALLFYCLCLRLLGRGESEKGTRLGAAFAALLFAFHPLRVQAVAWPSARGHLLSALFFLATLLLWLRALEPRGSDPRTWRRAAWATFVLALLCRTTAIALPAVLALLDVYPLRRLPGDPRRWSSPEFRRLWREKIPFVLPALVFALIEFAARSREGSIVAVGGAGLGERLARVFFGLGYYLEKTIVPFRLSPDYVWHWPESRAPYLLRGAGALAVAAASLALRRSRPAVLAAFAFYTITLLPMLGIVAFGHETVADRYSYIPCLAWALLAGAGLRGLARARSSGASGRGAFRLACAAAAACLALLLASTRGQLRIWRGSVELWRAALKDDPIHPRARTFLGLALVEDGRVDEAALVWQEQLRLYPSDDGTRANLAKLTAETWGAPPPAAKLYDDAGEELQRRGESERSVWFFDKALDSDPGSVRAHDDLCLALARLGRPDEPSRPCRPSRQPEPDQRERASSSSARSLSESGVSSRALR